MKISLPNILQDKDRNGRPRVYYRPPKVNGHRLSRMVRLREQLGTPAFMAEYQAAATGQLQPRPGAERRSSATKGSLRWLVEGYFASARFRTLADTTQRARRGILDSICLSVLETSRGSVERGKLPVAEMRAKHVRQIRDEKLEVPEAANGRLKALGQVFDWALAEELLTVDPTVGVERLHGRTGGFHTWTVDEVRQFEGTFPVGTKARLALALLLFTGVRRSDVVRLGKQFERDGKLVFTETKGANSRAITLRKRPTAKSRVIPILPELRAILDVSPTGELVYITSARGTPYKPESFTNWFHDRCVEAGLPHCSPHGLRKAGAKIAAEAKATTHQLMAIYGWETVKQAELYTREANMIAMADEAMHLVVPANKKGA